MTSEELAQASNESIKGNLNSSNAVDLNYVFVNKFNLL